MVDVGDTVHVQFQGTVNYVTSNKIDLNDDRGLWIGYVRIDTATQAIPTEPAFGTIIQFKNTGARHVSEKGGWRSIADDGTLGDPVAWDALFEEEFRQFTVISSGK